MITDGLANDLTILAAGAFTVDATLGTIALAAGSGVTAIRTATGRYTLTTTLQATSDAQAIPIVTLRGAVNTPGANSLSIARDPTDLTGTKWLASANNVPPSGAPVAADTSFSFLLLQYVPI